MPAARATTGCLKQDLMLNHQAKPDDNNPFRRGIVEFSHFIITRFNVNIYPSDFQARLENAWLSMRLDLFQKYCFPSVRAQTNQDFTWLVLFDEKTPDMYKRIIEAYAKYENFVPLYCGAYDQVMPRTVEYMQQAAPDAEWLLTTRLDNDDALSTKFVHCVHEVVHSLSEEHLKPSDTLYINFPNGLQLYEGDFYDFEDATNAFVSFIERRHDPHTVFWIDHPSIHKVAPVMQATTHPLWLQNVHGTNMYNHLRGKLSAKDYKKDFVCEFD